MDLLLIGGVSGSGKSVALAALEDSGYYAVNNLPLPLVAETAAYLAKANRDRVAIALDVKTAPGLSALPETIAQLKRQGGPCGSSTSTRRRPRSSSDSPRRG